MLFPASECLVTMAGKDERPGAEVEAAQTEAAQTEAAAVQKELEDMRETVKGLAEQAAEAKKESRKVRLDKAVASVKAAASRRSVCFPYSVYGRLSISSSGEEAHGDPLLRGGRQRHLA